MYSSARENRMLIVNGRLLHEGDRIAADLVIEQIHARSAVLAFRGYRYSVSF